MHTVWFDWLNGYILAIIVVVLLLCRFFTHNHQYWKKKGVPFVQPYPFIGTENITFKKLEDIEEERYHKYGKIYGLYVGNVPKLSLAEPALLKDILVRDFQYFTTRLVFNSGDPIFDKMLSLLEGDDWRRVRAIISPTFSTGKIKRMMRIFEDCSICLVKNIKAASGNGETVDVTKLFGAFTMDVIASAAFSTKIDCLNDPENEFVKRAKNAFKLDFGLKMILFIVMPNIMRNLNITLYDPENLNFFKRVIREIIKKRKKSGETKNDFLQLLMDTATEVENEEKSEDKTEDVTNNYGTGSAANTPLKSSPNKKLSMDEIVAQCVIFFLAGYHTTATTLSITMYLLALNQDIQQKLYEEITSVLSETDGELTYESLHKMKYLDNVISESLRMYTPATRLDRTANADYKLGNTGIVIPKGMVVTVPTYVMHRDPKLFPDPEIFNPDRFLTEEMEKHIVPYSYLPFGAGPRNCVGMRFALIEMKICLVYIICTFHTKECFQTRIPLEFYKAANVLQPKSIYLKLDQREDCVIKT